MLDYTSTLLAAPPSVRIRWIMALVLAGEINEVEAERLRSDAFGREQQEAA
jgi:hypothetical protein